MGVTHGEEVEGEGEEKGYKGEEAEFSLRFVATGRGHGIRIKIKMKIRRRQRHKSLIVNYEHGRLGTTAPTRLGA